MRVQIPEYTDRWAMGDRYGVVLKVTRGDRWQRDREIAHVKLDKSGKTVRVVLADWMTNPGNPYFAKAVVNRTWSSLLGRGIVDPVDDVRISNPPSNPELLDELGKRFTDAKYNFRSIVRDICNSRTYQLSSQANATNAGDELNFSRGAIRRIRAEILLDAIGADDAVRLQPELAVTVVDAAGGARCVPSRISSSVARKSWSRSPRNRFRPRARGSRRRYRWLAVSSSTCPSPARWGSAARSTSGRSGSDCGSRPGNTICGMYSAGKDSCNGDSGSTSSI